MSFHFCETVSHRLLGVFLRMFLSCFAFIAAQLFERLHERWKEWAGPGPIVPWTPMPSGSHNVGAESSFLRRRSKTRGQRYWAKMSASPGSRVGAITPAVFTGRKEIAGLAGQSTPPLH